MNDRIRVLHAIAVMALLPAAMDVALASAGQPTAPLPPGADDRIDVHRTVVDCVDDGDCVNTAACIEGACYAPMQRFLGIKPNAGNAGTSFTYRVSVDTGEAGLVVVGFTGPPQQVVAEGPGQNLFNYVDIVDEAEADYRDWFAEAAATENHLALMGCEIAPDRTYHVQAIFEGADPDNEADYSTPRVLVTSPHGDATGGGAVNTPPNGIAGLIDTFVAVLAFQNNQGAPKIWLDIEGAGGVPNGAWNLADVFLFVRAFQTNPYPGPHPADCP